MFFDYNPVDTESIGAPKNRSKVLGVLYPVKKKCRRILLPLATLNELINGIEGNIIDTRDIALMIRSRSNPVKFIIANHFDRNTPRLG